MKGMYCPFMVNQTYLIIIIEYFSLQKTKIVYSKLDFRCAKLSKSVWENKKCITCCYSSKHHHWLKFESHFGTCNLSLKMY